MEERMTRTLLVNVLRERLDIGIVDSTKAVNIIFDALGDEIAKHGWIDIPRFGRFSATAIPARVIKLSLTGESRELPAARFVRFRAAPALKAKLDANNTQPPLRLMRKAQRLAAIKKGRQPE
jgi:nucleoid DNA-binding protein